MAFQWACDSCGFKNRAGNEVCGGTGSAGCKLPPGGGFGAMTMKAMGGKGAGFGGGGQWECAQCNFKNRESNEVCGGNGTAGCKSPKVGGMMKAAKGKGKAAAMAAMGFGGMPVINKFAAMGAMGGKAMGGKAMGQKAFGAKAGRSPTMSAGMGGQWQCVECNFMNKEINEFCGGLGPVGCNALPGGGQWMCAQCNFTNKNINQICGGNGTAGCKNPRPSNKMVQGGKGAAFGGMAAFAGAPMGFAALGKGAFGKGAFGKGAGKGGKDQSTWVCSCGFSNTVRNTICGGEGPMGCNAEKPSDWVCDCGFINKPANDICGGKGPMGCNAERN